MRIQKTFMEQIKDSSTPLNSPELWGGGGVILRWGGAEQLGELFSLLAWQEGRQEESHRERNWTQPPRLMLPIYFWVPS